MSYQWTEQNRVPLFDEKYQDVGFSPSKVNNYLGTLARRINILQSLFLIGERYCQV